MFIIGFRRSLLKTTICYTFFLLTAGLLRLIMHWWKHWLLLATHTKCPLNEAEKVLIYETFQGKHTMYYVKDIITIDGEALQEICSKKTKKISRNSQNLLKKLTERETSAINADCPYKVSHHTGGGRFECESNK
jgi:cation-transporting ATPase 13A3/4/5